MTLPEIAYRELRKAILDGALRPGQMLRQDEVAMQLGVSVSPLREALSRLQAEGILVLHPRRGYAVAELDRDSIVEISNLQILLEVELARLSISRRSDTDIANVEAILASMRRIADQYDDDSLPQWFELNARLHDALLSPAGCPHYLKALHHARGVIEAYIRKEIRLTGDVARAQHEHELLAQAFIKGDAEEFLRLTQLHSVHTRERLLSRLDESYV